MSYGIIFCYSFLFLTQVLTVLTSIIRFNEYITDVGSNISIPCLARGSIMWVKDECNSTKVQKRGPNLMIYNVQKSDAGTYVCLVNRHNDDFTSDWEFEQDSEAAYYSDEEYETFARNADEALTIILKIRSVPGPVTQLSVRLSTILGVLKWEFSQNSSGGYPLKSFTAEFRKYVDVVKTRAEEEQWELLDPNNIPANVRYYEIYHLKPNTTYEFRIWANNYLGTGEKAHTFATTLDQLTDEDLMEIILKDVKSFDPRIWIYAVSVSMSAMVLLGCTVCLLLVRDHYEELEFKRQQEEDEWDTIELVPNIILNPGYYEPEDLNDSSPPYTRTIIFGEDVLSNSSGGSEHEEPMSFKRKVSLFFTGDTIKRL